ncbi:MAG TPA: GPW/gp25 family protein [Pseudonocardiaceae bacterium]|nr:GPW/gp25 family protein [Pseudonocardiaceae bacterium]
MDHGFLGSGWAFPVVLDEDHTVRMTGSGEEAIRQSIWMILRTARGERVMRPDFGCGIHDYVFDVHDAGIASRICGAVREALAGWEPRIDVLDVSAIPDTATPNTATPDSGGSGHAEPNRLLIEINYQIRGSNSRFNLVYPFYLT